MLDAAAVERLQQMPVDELAALVARLRWEGSRHDFQIPPGPQPNPKTGVLEDWTVWALIAGRGAGKTRTAAETVRDWAWADPGSRTLVSARTFGDLRGTCFTGESGLCNVIPPEMVAKWNVSLLEMHLTNGSLIKGIPAETPDAFRGPQWHYAWADELAAWEYAQQAWDMIMFALRLGEHPRMMVTTTPKPHPLIKQIVDNTLGIPCVVTRGSSYVNRQNLAPTFIQNLAKYEGTMLGRQEIYGELLDPEESGIIKRSWWQIWPKDRPLPHFDYIVISLDTAFSEESHNKKTKNPDYSACTVWGFFQRGKDKGWGCMLLNAWQDRLGMPELITKTLEEKRVRYGGEKPAITGPWGPAKIQNSGKTADLILIEDKGSGISLRQMLAREGVTARPYNPGKADKLQRLHAVSHIFAAGHIYVPENVVNPGKPRPWAEEAISQVCSFHGVDSLEHDDYVDSTTQATRFFAIWSETAMIKKKKDEEERKPPPAVRVNPYAV